MLAAETATVFPMSRSQRRAAARITEQRRRGAALDARQWFETLRPRLYVVDAKTGERVRTGFRNVIENGEHR